jgi:hypothetical protein
MWKKGDIMLTQKECFSRLSQLFGFEDFPHANDIIEKLYFEGRSFLYVSFFVPIRT